MLSEFNSPFTSGQAETLSRLLGALDSNQRTWLSGYLAGMSAMHPDVQPGSGSGEPAGPTHVPPEAGGAVEVAVLYATETGNSRELAARLKARIEAQGFRAAVYNAAEFKARKLEDERIALFISSTHGEGDPPEPARPFVEALNGRRAPKLAGLTFSVLALGDSSYRRFCQAGKDLEARLQALGAERLHPRQDCDVDFAVDAETWMNGVLQELRQWHERQWPPALGVTGSPPRGQVPPPAREPSFSRDHPYQAELLENLVLNDEGSTKTTRHLELLLEGSGLTYQPGDVLGLFPRNLPEEVAAVIAMLKLDPEEPVAVRPGTEKPLREALEADCELARLTPPVAVKYAQLAGNGMVDLLKPENEARLWEYLQGRGVRDLIQDFPLSRAVSGRELTGLLRRMPPRLYSIASSLKAHPGEVHLTVAPARFPGPGEERLGVFSRQCHELVQPGETLQVFVQENPDFRLPEDAAVPLIMIGPGSGVAPFRAFLEEREETGAGGPTWLFFGERNFRTDFLYQVEWQQRLKSGVLSRMDVAFSRDTSRKVYVQDRLRERAGDLFAWLEQGACIYVCGDEKRMAPGVHEVLVQIVQEQGHKTREAAGAYLDELKVQQRYRRDVY
jgi:sulfite reductase (NADPH) flavoprotein alpha-component